MPTKWEEVILPFERMILVPGLHSVWSKRAFVQVMPLGTEEIRLQTPERRDVSIRHIEIDPANQITMEFGQVDFLLSDSSHKPDEIIFRPTDTAGVNQMENVNMEYIRGGATFGWRFRNTSPLFVIAYWLSAQIFTRRQAN